ncbi:MAG: MSHA biogenesis protein MshP [Bacteroidota bacterium]
MKRKQQGFGVAMATVLLLLLSAIAAAVIELGVTQNTTSAQDILSARALAAARTGTELGLYKALSSTTPGDPWKTCSSLSQTFDLSAATGFRVTVTCKSWSFNEGESTPGNAAVLRTYRIEATACNSNVSCPDAAMATTPGYIERVRQVSATN